MTTKDAYWFSHDSNAKDDPKVMMLIDQLGLEGYGIYWVLVETLREQPGYRYPVKMLPILAKRYYTSGEKMAAVVRNYDLFAIEAEDFFFSPSLDRRMLHLQDKREKFRLAGIASAEKRKQLASGNDVSTTLQQRSTNKVKESIVKYIKEEVKEPLRDVIFKWLEYKKERKDKQYTMMGIKQFTKNLHEYSGGDKKRALDIIENSIANNWQGIFPPKQQQQQRKEEFIPKYPRLEEVYAGMELKKL